MIRKLLLLTLMVGLVFSVVACTENTVDANDNQDAVAIVNEEEINRSEFDSMLERMTKMYTQQGMDFESEEGKGMLQELEQHVLDNLINEKVLIQEADKKGYGATEEEISMEIEQIKLQFNSEEEFQQALEESQLTLEELHESIANEIKINQYIENEVEMPVATEEEARELYEQYSAMMGEEAPEFEMIQQQLKVEIENQKLNQEMSNIIQQLVEASEIEILI
ncbi:MAG: SurA N-terminal domain-containing protein [Clostridiaceae bacterium]|nr:SurA N-terminal domain-containing protein [Clostridiaceae bacterium]